MTARAVRLLVLALGGFIAALMVAGVFAPFVEWPFRMLVAAALAGAIAAICALCVVALAQEVAGREP